MAYIIILLALLSGYHFIMESIYIPSERLKLRYKLFEQRDKLRNLEIDGNVANKRALIKLERAINTNIGHLAAYNIGFRVRVDSIMDDTPEIKKAIAKDIKLIYETEGVKEIAQMKDYYMGQAFMANMKGWTILITPFYCIFYVFDKIGSTYKKVYANIKFKQMWLTPEKIMENKLRGC